MTLSIHQALINLLEGETPEDLAERTGMAQLTVDAIFEARDRAVAERKQRGEAMAAKLRAGRAYRFECTMPTGEGETVQGTIERIYSGFAGAAYVILCGGGLVNMSLVDSHEELP